MDKKKEIERRKYLGLETFYLKMKELLKEVEDKLNALQAEQKI